MMADYTKDRSLAQINSGLTFIWMQENRARENWRNFTVQDFAWLAKSYRVDWVVVERGSPDVSQLSCPYQNEQIAVCRIR